MSRARRVWRVNRRACAFYPSTTLRAVPLPIFDGEELTQKEMGAGVATGPHCLGGLTRTRRCGPGRRAVSGEPSKLALRRLPGSPPRPKPRTVRREARPEGPAGCRRNLPPSGNSVRLRFRSALSGGSGLAPFRVPNGGGSVEPPFPRSRAGSRGKPPRRLGSGWTGNRPSPIGPSSCRASAEAAASAWPWLAPGCRCRGGFVSRPALHVPIPKDLPAPAVAGEAAVRFRPAVSVHPCKLSSIPIRRKRNPLVDNKDNGDRMT
ncbi:MAG: hypothetical protein QOC65_35 [Sphingomonadales bacterium]|nr:hypothetical protein [Sphingomonadales bacterium]